MEAINKREMAMQAMGLTKQKETVVGSATFYFYDNAEKQAPTILTVNGERWFVFSRNMVAERALLALLSKE